MPLFLFALMCALPCLSLQGAWLKSLDEGKLKAAEEGREIYLVFTSLAISGACVQLDKRVLSQDEFQAAVADRFILVHLDVPVEGKPGMGSPLAANRVVAQAFGVEVFPSTFFLTSAGVAYARETGMPGGGPLEHAARLLEKSSQQAARVTALEAAYQKEGMARAKALVAVIGKAPLGADPVLYARHLTELEKADPDDTLGFRKQRLAEQGFQKLNRAVEKAFQKKSYEEVGRLVDAYLAKFQPAGVLRQKALFPKLAAFNHGNEVALAIQAAGEIIEIDAESPHGKLAAQILKRLNAR